MRSYLIIAAALASGMTTTGPVVNGVTFEKIAVAAQDNGSYPIAVSTARVLDAFGTVERRATNNSTSPWHMVNVGDTLSVQTDLRTGDNSASLLQLPGGHLLRIGAKTTVQLRELGKDNAYSFKVLSGQIWSMVNKANHPARYEVETPSAVAGVTGTIFGVTADDKTGETIVTTNEGSVLVHQNGIQAAVTEGNFIRIDRPTGVGRLRRPLRPYAQTLAMRQTWVLLRHEGVLVRRHEVTNGYSGFAKFRLQRDIEKQLFRARQTYRSPNLRPAPFTGQISGPDAPGDIDPQVNLPRRGVLLDHSPAGTTSNPGR